MITVMRVVLVLSLIMFNTIMNAGWLQLLAIWLAIIVCDGPVTGRHVYLFFVYALHLKKMITFWQFIVSCDTIVVF